MKKLFLILFLLPGIAFSSTTTQVDFYPRGEFFYEYGWNKKAPSTQPILLRLISNEVDVSPLVSALEEVRNYPVNNFMEMERLSYRAENKIKELCQDSETCKNNANKKIRDTITRINTDMENKILYPEYYFISHKRAQTKLSENKKNNSYDKALDDISNDSIYCYGQKSSNPRLLSNISDIIRNGSDEMYSPLFEKIKSLDKRSQKQILMYLRWDFTFGDFPKKCLKKKNEGHPVCKYMLKDMNRFKKRVYDIVELIYETDILKTTEARDICLDCSAIKFKQDEYGNMDFFQDIRENIDPQCFDPKPGEVKLVNAVWGSRVGHILKREEDGSFSAHLNLKFEAGEDYDGNIPREQVPAHYMKKVQQCISKANTKMLGPNGEKLKIVISDQKKFSLPTLCEDEPYDHQFIFNITSKNLQPRIMWDKHLNSDADCSEIIHTVFTLLGIRVGDWTLREALENNREKSLLGITEFNRLLYGHCKSKTEGITTVYPEGSEIVTIPPPKAETTSQKRAETPASPEQEVVQSTKAETTPSPEREVAQSTKAETPAPAKRTVAQPSKETKKGFWSGVVGFLKGETMPPPKLRINGKIKEYPKTQEGWRNYWKDKRRMELENSK